MPFPRNAMTASVKDARGLPALRRAFFRRHLVLHPEEATTLGVHEHDEELRDVSERGLAETRAFYAETLEALDALDRGGLSRDDAVDHRVMHGLASFEVRAHDDALATRNQELSLAPYTTLQHQLAQAETSGDWARIGRRAAKTAKYLRDHAENLARGMDAARGVDVDIVRHFVEYQLPAAATFYGGLAALPTARGHALTSGDARALEHGASLAAVAYQEHVAFHRERLLPRARETSALGHDEVRFRLAHVFGIERSADALVDDARAVLADAQGAILRATRAQTMEDATAIVRSRQAATPRTDDDVFPLYASLTERARAFVQERRIFAIPSDLEIGFRRAYPGMTEGATNWPAPLLDRTKRAHFLVSPRAADHPLLWAPLLAVHEGIPGHSLQSAWWQRTFGAHEAPVRFLLVDDDVAAAHQCFGTMLAVEGFATYVEDRMRRAGYYDEGGTVWAHVVRAIRAVRVIVDLGLATGRVSRAEAAAMLARECCLDEERARGQVLRYQRIPLQATTYLVGAREIERLHDECARACGDAFDEPAFHDALFSYGPVPPAWIAPHLMDDLA
jgi:uncharacterized protein (DUF885 family)